MKILLIGEYSRLHNSLKEGLQKNGHKVTLLGSGDGFKNYPVDIKIDSIFFNLKLFKLFAKLIDRLFKISLNELEMYYKANKIISDLKGYDVVQLINENAFRTLPSLEILLIKTLMKNNEKLFLLSCGVDQKSVEHSLNSKFKYSILTPYFENPSLKKSFKHILKYNTREYVKLYEFILANANGVISSDIDYHIPYIKEKKYLGLIPNPINLDKIKYKKIKSIDKIKILHGVNSKNYIKKGNIFFDKALKAIENKYDNKVEIITTTDLDYNEYIKSVENCHILLDQVYAYDQGYNALEAMAIGKVVFTGAEKEWLELYNIKENSVAINALPDHTKIIESLEWLINNPSKIMEISANAREFIEKNHNYISIAEHYEKVWSKN
ncbi:MAG: glycosyltransferase [Pelagibacterales bacterium]|nr:glycosyltransferase [Pelagibacterales bacterium]